VNFIYSILVVVGMGAVLGLGCVLTAKGSPWLLIISVVGFIVAFGKIGCMPPSDAHHDADHH